MKRAITEVNGINIFYRDTEEGEQTMLCLHGKWGRGETWSDFISRYRDRYRVVAPDQRGHGLSDKPVARYAAEDFAEDAYRLIEHLDCAPVIVVGHSMGGRAAAFLTALYPNMVKGCVILDIPADGPRKAISDLPPEEVKPVDI